MEPCLNAQACPNYGFQDWYSIQIIESEDWITEDQGWSKKICIAEEHWWKNMAEVTV